MGFFVVLGCFFQCGMEACRWGGEGFSLLSEPGYNGGLGLGWGGGFLTTNGHE